MEAPDGGEASGYKFIALAAAPETREELRAHLTRHGISLAGGVYETLLHDDPRFRPHASPGPGQFRAAQDFAARHFCLPAWPGLTPPPRLNNSPLMPPGSARSSRTIASHTSATWTNGRHCRASPSTGILPCDRAWTTIWCTTRSSRIRGDTQNTVACRTAHAVNPGPASARVSRSAAAFASAYAVLGTIAAVSGSSPSCCPYTLDDDGRM